MEGPNDGASALKLDDPGKTSNERSGLENLINDASALKLDGPEKFTKKKLGLMDLPTEVHIKIVELCLRHPVRDPGPRRGPLGRNAPKYQGKLLGGSVRELCFVDRYWRDLTAPYLFERICVNDLCESSIEDYLRDTYKRMQNATTHRWLQYTQRFTISLGRMVDPPKLGHEENFINLLNYVQTPHTVRYALEQKETSYSILPTLRTLFNRYHRNGVELQIFKPRQLEFYCYWGEHTFDFQFLAWPYVNVERIWLDYNIDHIRADSLCLDRLRNLEYVMCRSYPINFFYNEFEMDQFKGYTASDGGDRPPKLQQLAGTLRHLKHFALCGPLFGPVTGIAPLLADMESLEQLDITDQQAICDDQIHEDADIWHPNEEIEWAMKHTDWLSKHPNNVDRIEAATVFFTTLPKLQRICFVRDQVGVFYHAIRDHDGGLERVEKGETMQERFHILKYERNSPAWRCGFPNVLNYNLRDQPVNALRADYVFWRNPDYLAGDKSVIPEALQWVNAMEEYVYGAARPMSIQEYQAHMERQVSIVRGAGRRRDVIVEQQQVVPDLDAQRRNIPEGSYPGANGQSQGQTQVQVPSAVTQRALHPHWRVTPDQLATKLTLPARPPTL